MGFSSIRYLVKEGFRNLWSNRMMSFASVGVLISCLLLTGSALLFSLNVANAMDSLQGASETTVYLKDDVATLEAVQIGEEIGKISNIESYEFVSKETALQEAMEAMGDDGYLLEDFQGEENPLPHAYRITVADIAKYDQTIAQIEKLDGVEQVASRSDAAERLTNINQLISTVGFWVVLILSIVSHVHNLQHHSGDHVFPPPGNQHYEIGRRQPNGLFRVPFIVERRR